MRPKICYVHGFNSSRRSFTFLAQELENSGDVLIDYDSHQSLEKSIAQVLKYIPKKEPVILVGHSLGGLITMLIAGRGNADVQKVITISSPLGGSKVAAIAKWFMGSVPLIGDITPTSRHIRELAIMKPNFPVLSIVSTGGSLPTSSEPNDSVVTVASQRALSSAKKVEIKASHFEILLHERTTEAIRKFIREED